MAANNVEYRQALLTLLARLDQLGTGAEEILAEPADTELLPLAEELRELLVEMRAKVEEKLDQLATG
jgi:hypothetical protein